MKDHEIAKLVNDLRDIAVQFHDSGCLRETIRRRLVPEIEQLRKRLELAHAIRNDTEHQIVMARIGELMPSDPIPNTPDGEELSLLVALVTAYETERYPDL